MAGTRCTPGPRQDPRPDADLRSIHQREALERLDHHFDYPPLGRPGAHAEPSEYFRRQCYISIDPDESTLEFTARHPLVDAERIIWASDYPHPDAKFPGVVAELLEHTAGLDAAARARIVGGNAREIYRLPAA